MRHSLLLMGAAACLLITASSAALQTDAGASAPTTPSNSVSVPRLVKFNGAVTDLTGKPLTGPVDVTFSIYKSQTDAAPLWQETQTVQADAAGQYSVLLGAMSVEGLPMDLFTSGEARWLGVVAGKLPEQPRVLLVSVPYALKAGDAETLGGKPASAYLLASQDQSASGATAGAGTSTTAAGNATGKPVTLATATGITPNAIVGNTNYIPVFTDDSGSMGNSLLYQTGGNVGMGTTTPAETLDVNGVVSSKVGKFFFKRDMTDDPGRRNWGYVTEVSTVGDFQILESTTNTSDPSVSRVAITGDGKVGIGTTTPAQLLDVAGVVKSGGGVLYLQRNLTDQAGRRNWGWATETSNVGDVALLESATNTATPSQPVMTILNTGAVGIGTTTPAATLEVNGTAKFDGAVTLATTEAVTGSVTTSNQLVSTVGTGTAPLSVTSTTLVPNLNADTVDGLHASAFQPVGTYATLGSNSFTGDQTISGNVGIGTSVGTRRLYVVSPASNLAAVKAVGQTASNVGNLIVVESRFGEWGDSASSVGVLGTSDLSNGVAGMTNHTGDGAAGAFINNQPYGKGLEAGSFGAGCTIWGYGTISCTGGKAAEVRLSDERKVRLYAIESPQVWFEDFGTGSLAEGVAIIQLDPVFADTVNPAIPYHVFLTAKADCEGLYVATQSPTGFEVRELKGGKSNVPFDYRVVALRKGWENLRLEDVTDTAFNPGRVGAHAATSGP